MLLDEERALDDRVEQVAIEAVHVGDYLRLGSRLRCVLVKAPLRADDRATGWQLVLSDGDSVWLPRRARVTRRRFELGR